MTNPRFPIGPRVVLRMLLPTRIAEPLIQEIEGSYRRDRAQRGVLYAYVAVWREVFNTDVLRLARRHRRVRFPASSTLRTSQDVRNAVRSLWRSPGYALIVVVPLCLGIGLPVAVWSVVDRVLFSDVDFAYRGGDVVSLSWRGDGRLYNAFSAADYLDIKQSNQTFDDIHTYSERSFTVRVGAVARRMTGMTVSAGLLEMIGAVPTRGRFFSDTDDATGAQRVVVLGYGFWLREYGGREDVLGQNVSINDAPYEIVGVAPAWLRFRAPGEATVGKTPQDHVDFFVPNAFAAWRFRVRRAYSYYMVGRLAESTTLDQAAADVRAIVADVNHDVPVVVRSFEEHLLGYARRPLMLMLGAVALVFLLSLANAANLVAVRTIGRRREIAVRMALGAGRKRSVLPLSVEAVILVVVAAIAAMAFALTLLRLIDVTVFLPTLVDQSSVRGSVVAMVTLGSIATVLLAVVPFMRHDPSYLGETLRTAGALRQSWGDVRQQRFLVVVQLALSVVVLASASTITRSVARMQAIDLGFSADRAVSFRIALPNSYDDPTTIKTYVREYLSRLRSLVGVEAAGAVNFLPFRNHGNVSGSLSVDDRTTQQVFRTAITPGFLEAMGIERIAGRDFTDMDDANGPAVTLLAESTARALFGGMDVVDRIVRDADGSAILVIGVVGDIRSERPDEDPRLTMYLPAYQDDHTQLSVVIKHHGPLPPLREARTIASALDSRAPLFEEADLRNLIDRSIIDERIMSMLLTLLAAVSLAIGALGVYSTMAFAVAHRRAEFGTRVALGATSTSIVRSVVRGALATGVLGIFVGSLAYSMFGRTLSTLLFEIKAIDPLSIGLACGALLLLSVLGSAIPAFRASTVDPMESLR